MHIYFSGIGGVGLGPLAEIALDAGHTVSGSDTQEGPLTRQLRQKGISVSLDQSGESMKQVNDRLPIDWFVYTSALADLHPELELARELDIVVSKRDELLAHIISEKDLKLIAIAGTHGKTTTTGMFVWALKQLGIAVSYSVGTTLAFGPSGHYDKNSHYFVYECDEFDRNFLHFQPYLSLVTSIDYDHPDTYPKESDYFEAFKQFGRQSQQLITWNDQHAELFADHSDAWILQDTMDIPLAGNHNRRNATLVLKALEKLGLVHESSLLSDFPGTNRRFEKLADNLYSDYGHHPIEIAATLQMAREISDHVVLIYQPHQNVRQHEIKDDYTNQFDLAERVYWLPTYLSRENPELEILSPQQLASSVTNLHNIYYADLNDELWNVVQQARNADKLVLCMGAGSIDLWIRSCLTDE